MPDLKTPSCRLIYFGGYGHKLLTDVDSRNRSFIVDEASWVFGHWCSNIHHFPLKFPPFHYLTLSPGWRCVLGMEQWGSYIWPNEFQLEWTKNQRKPIHILWNRNDYGWVVLQLSSFLKFWEDFTVVDCVCRVVLLPPGLPTPAPHWGEEATFVEEESWWASFMAIYAYESKTKWQKHKPDCFFLTQETRTNDVHCLDFETWTWTEMYVVLKAWETFTRFASDSVINILSRTPASPIPVGRSWHTLTAVSDNSLFLFGGLSVDCKPMSKKKLLPLFSVFVFQSVFFLIIIFEFEGDGWLLDVEKKIWREVDHPFKNKPR